MAWFFLAVPRLKRCVLQASIKQKQDAARLFASIKSVLRCVRSHAAAHALTWLSAAVLVMGPYMGKQSHC